MELTSLPFAQGHHLWQASLLISEYLEENAPSLIKDKSVLELGAAAGLPSILCSLHGAKRVVATDYPDADLIENLRFNVQQNCATEANVRVQGYLWGADVASLLEGGDDAFDVLVLADLLFNHSEHGKLISSIQRTLRKAGPSDSFKQLPQALVFFTPYRPWLFEKDMAFFDLARESGFSVEKILEKKVEKVMFEEDPGDEQLRRTVFGYRLTWAD